MVSLEYLKSVFGGKRVFVTGHTGFKGAWLIQILHEAGAVVKGYSLEPETSLDLYVSIQGDTLCDSAIGDIRELKKLHHEIQVFQPDFVFHLAAQSLVRRSYEQPVYTWEVNVTGTANLLEVLRNINKTCVAVCITTDKVYENPEKGLPFAETDPLGGYDPYSASKAGSELVIASYRNSFFSSSDSPVRLASARAGNVIGGGDYARDRIIPDFVKARMAGKSLHIRRPEAVRPWQHVLEPLAGYLLLAARLKNNPGFASAFNFGPETTDVLTVRALVGKAEEVWPGEKTHFENELNGPHEAGLLLLDISKAKKELNFNPQWNSSKAITETVNWYKNESLSAREKCLNQIRKYFA
ncbi:MAG: CDP-glucose 4,6-dehydratase [Flavobacteriales bacterium]|nr:CDP-glucose 4,6-dehydratase [Flavobacteriales bacterium]